MISVAAAPAWRSSSPFSATLSRGELERGFATERMERNTKRNVKASVTRKCMFVFVWKFMFYLSSWLFLSYYPSSRRCNSRGFSTACQATYHRYLTINRTRMGGCCNSTFYRKLECHIMACRDSQIHVSWRVYASNRHRTYTGPIYKTRSSIRWVAVVSLVNASATSWPVD